MPNCTLQNANGEYYFIGGDGSTALTLVPFEIDCPERMPGVADLKVQNELPTGAPVSTFLFRGLSRRMINSIFFAQGAFGDCRLVMEGQVYQLDFTAINLDISSGVTKVLAHSVVGVAANIEQIA